MATDLSGSPTERCSDIGADAGALELLQEGELPADHWDWESGAGFRFARDEDLQEESAAVAPPQRWVSVVALGAAAKHA